MLDPLMFVLVVGVGLAAGIASGLFGVGGGILMVPAVRYVLGETFHGARAVSLLVIVASGAVGVYTHSRHKSVDFRKGLYLVVGGVLVTPLAVAAAEQTAPEILQTLFGALLVLTGLRIRRPGPPRERSLGPRLEFAYFVGLGALSGILAGAFGVGGGILMVPGLIFGGAGVHLAVGTSLLAVLGNAVAGSLRLATMGYGPLFVTVGIPLVLGALPGAHWGSRLAHKIKADRLRGLFGGFLVLIGLAMGLESAFLHRP